MDAEAVAFNCRDASATESFSRFNALSERLISVTSTDFLFESFASMRAPEKEAFARHDEG
jgi:hypothetical protein